MEYTYANNEGSKMASKLAGWKRKSKKDEAAVIVREGVAHVVPVKGGSALRIYTTTKSAVASGIGRKFAKMLFKLKDGAKTTCSGKCAVAFSDDGKWVWCESLSCDSPLCECRLYEMWKDKKGMHDEDRGAPDPEYKFKRVTGRAYGCMCMPIAKTEPGPDPVPPPDPN